MIGTIHGHHEAAWNARAPLHLNIIGGAILDPVASLAAPEASVVRRQGSCHAAALHVLGRVVLLGRLRHHGLDFVILTGCRVGQIRSLSKPMRQGARKGREGKKEETDKGEQVLVYRTKCKSKSGQHTEACVSITTPPCDDRTKTSGDSVLLVTKDDSIEQSACQAGTQMTWHRILPADYPDKSRCEPSNFHFNLMEKMR